MAFNVTFYSFSKRENATYRPTGTGETFSCVLKADSNIASPEIILDIGTANNPSWNYAYIAEFNRYYYVSDWRWIDNRLWSASLSTDLLATYKDEIGASELYVLRSSAASDGNIIDDYYPCKMTCTTQTTIGSSPWIHTIGNDDIDLSAGVFVVGYVTSQQPNDSHMYGSVVYSAMKQSGLRALVDALLDDSLLSGSGFLTSDASLPLQKSLIDPLSYIKSCIWLPVLYESLPGTSLTDLNIWDWSIPCTHKIISNDPPYIQYTVTLNLIKHPLTQTRGNYLNTSPYTRVNLDLPPFGNIELDTSLTANAAQVQALITFDLITGQGRSRIIIDGVNTDTGESQIGVPIQLSQVMKDYLGAAQSGFNGIVGTISSALNGNIAGAISSAGNGIANGVRAMQPRTSSVSGNGSFAHLKNRPRLYHQFMIPVDEDNDHCGRPLCQIRRVDTLPGYLLIKDGEIDIDGFTGEAEAVRAYLEGGFFYG
jgi:hypothetical protein